MSPARLLARRQLQQVVRLPGRVRRQRRHQGHGGGHQVRIVGPQAGPHQQQRRQGVGRVEVAGDARRPGRLVVASQLVEGFGQGPLGRGVVGVEFEVAQVGARGPVPALGQAEEVGQVQQGRGVGRVRGHGLLVAGAGLVEAPLAGVEAAQGVANRGRGRVAGVGDHLLVDVDGQRVVAAGGVEAGQQRRVFGIDRVEGDRLQGRALGALQVAAGLQQQRLAVAVAVLTFIEPTQLAAPVQVAAGAVQVAVGQQQPGQAVVGRPQLRILGQGPGQFGAGGVRLPLAQQLQPQGGAGRGMVAAGGGQGLATIIRGLGVAGPALGHLGQSEEGVRQLVVVGHGLFVEGDRLVQAACGQGAVAQAQGIVVHGVLATRGLGRSRQAGADQHRRQQQRRVQIPRAMVGCAHGPHLSTGSRLSWIVRATSRAGTSPARPTWRRPRGLAR